MGHMTPPPSVVSGARWSTFFGGLVSLAFWVSLVASAMLFAAVSLAPKLLAWRTLQEQFRSQQTRLLVLEQQTEQLDRVVQALEQDPQFSAELARLEFDALRPGEEVIAVDGSLSLNPIVHDRPEARISAQSADPWLPWLKRLAGDEPLRLGLLAAAACVVIVAFTFLHEGLESPEPSVVPGGSWWQRAAARYRGGVTESGSRD